MNIEHSSLVEKYKKLQEINRNQEQKMQISIEKNDSQYKSIFLEF